MFSCGLCWSYILTHVILSGNDNKVRVTGLGLKFEGLPIKQPQEKRNVLRKSRKFLRWFSRIPPKCIKKFKVETSGRWQKSKERSAPSGTALTKGLTTVCSQELYFQNTHCLMYWLGFCEGIHTGCNTSSISFGCLEIFCSNFRRKECNWHFIIW